MSLFLAGTSLAMRHGHGLVSGERREDELEALVEDLLRRTRTAASIGMPYFSEIALAALVAPEPNGANRNCTLSSVIIRSADCTARGVFEA